MISPFSTSDPEEPPARVPSLLERHILTQIESVTRPPLGILKHPFLVPGGIFHDELWDWDSFWITKATVAIHHQLEEPFKGTFINYAIGSWINFFEHQSSDGIVPIMIKSDNSDFFGCAAGGEIPRNQAKPVFGQFALAVSSLTGDSTWVGPYFDRLLKFYDRWFSYYGTGSGLLVWGTDVAIGVDNDPTTYGRPAFSSANLLLNCLLYADLIAAADLAGRLGRSGDSGKLLAQAESLGLAIQRECWDAEDGFFYTVDVQCDDHRSKYLPGLKPGMDMTWRTLPLKVKMFTGFLPMWCGIATDEQARRLVEEHLRNENEFWAPFGLRSVSRGERMYEPAIDSANPSNWLGPIWIVASYMVYEGLKRYGYAADAAELAEKTQLLLEEDLRKTGTLHECYHPDTGSPNFNADFLSWNVLALLMK